jgi:hypothetical protein
MLVYSPWSFGEECGHRNVANTSPHNTALIPEDLTVYFRKFGRLIAARTVACDMAPLLYLSIPCVADTFDPCSVCSGRNLNHSSIVSYWSVWQTIELYAVCHFIQYNHDHRDLSRLNLSRILAFPVHHLTVVYVCLVISMQNLNIWNVLF